MPEQSQQRQQSQNTNVPPTQPPTVPPSQAVATPQPAGTSNLPTKAEEVERGIAETPVYGGVSWEEVRKGQPPRVIKNPDQAIWSDRFTSQLQLINMTGGRWQPVRPLFVPE